MWKNRLLYLALLACGTILAILYNVYSTGLAAVLLWLLPFVLLAFLLLGIWCVKARPLPLKELAQKGDVLGVGFAIENKSFLPGLPGKAVIEVRTSYGKKRQLLKRNLVLKGRGKSQVNMPIVAKHCGTIEVRYKRFWLFDYFGLWALPKKGAKGRFLVRVLPELVELTGDYAFAGWGGESEEVRFSSLRPGDDPSEVFGFHEYRPGDRPQSIHWKLSSKKEGLMAKEYSLPILVHTGIWLDFGKEPRTEQDLDAWDGALTALFSLSVALLERDCPHFVYFGGESFLVEAEEEIAFVFDEIYRGEFWERKEPSSLRVANLFYIGDGKEEEQRELVGSECFLWMVDTGNVQGILEGLHEAGNI